jgi:hypothetical protein
MLAVLLPGGAGELWFRPLGLVCWGCVFPLLVCVGYGYIGLWASALCGGATYHRRPPGVIDGGASGQLTPFSRQRGLSPSFTLLLSVGRNIMVMERGKGHFWKHLSCLVEDTKERSCHHVAVRHILSHSAFPTTERGRRAGRRADILHGWNGIETGKWTIWTIGRSWYFFNRQPAGRGPRCKNYIIQVGDGVEPRVLNIVTLASRGRTMAVVFRFDSFTMNGHH